ncbi:MAG TPA: DoxX family protein [Thermoanaerobaculia bacterium]
MAKRGALFFGGTNNAAATDVGLLVLRVFAGLALAFGHGLGKFPPSDRFITGVGGMGFPLPFVFAWAAALAELAGGILLALGLATRPAALVIAATMATAGFIRHAPDPFGRKELAFAYLAVAILFVLAGAGRYSVDALLRKR